MKTFLSLIALLMIVGCSEDAKYKLDVDDNGIVHCREIATGKFVSAELCQ